MYSAHVTYSLVLFNLGDPMDDHGGTRPPGQQDVQGSSVICDGLLCSILRAMSHSANKAEFVTVIERDCDEEEILTARTKLFTFYSDVNCDKQKKPILDVTRGSVKKNIEDIVEQMIKIDKTEKARVFFMPWDYTIKPFNSDTMIRAELIEKELGTEIDTKIDSLKQEMLVKNQAILELIHSKFNEVVQHVTTSTKAMQAPSYANVTGAGLGQQASGGSRVEHKGQNSDQEQASIPTFRLPTAPTPYGGGGGHSDEGGGGFGRNRLGSSSKRRRGERANSGG